MREQIEQAEAEVTRCQGILDQIRPLRDLTRAERAERAGRLRDSIGERREVLGFLREAGESMLRQIAEGEAELIVMQSSLNLLENFTRASASSEIDLDRAQLALDALQLEGRQDGETPKARFLTLIYTKLKTIRPISGLETTGQDFARRIAKYGTYADYEQGTIISPRQDMVRLLHDIGVGQGLVNGLVAPGPEVLNLEKLLTRVLTAIEVPDPQFDHTDLPKPYYMRVAGQYILQTDPIGERLWAYAAMADHIAHVFDLRLREDVASLKSIVEAKEQFQLMEDHDPVLSKVWDDQGRNNMNMLWGAENRTPQQVFQRIVQTYDPSFNVDGPYLDAAIPANSLGVLYRLLKATARDIHSWNLI